MAKPALKTLDGGGSPVDEASVLAALPFPVLVIDRDNAIRYLNGAGEQFFRAGASTLLGLPLTAMVMDDSPLMSLISQVRATATSVSEHDVTIHFPKIGSRRLTVSVCPAAVGDDDVAVSFHEQSIAQRIDQQLVHRNAARSVTALAGMLAHEVKNPLSGIKGAAQLLEQTVGDDDRELTRLICDEADRINSLVNRMGVFDDGPITDRTAVNIHEVLERVRQIAEAGFGRDIRFIEEYDPSLPPVEGNRDQLIQVVLNLVKNACEAAPPVGGCVILKSAYQHGVRLAVPGGGRRVRLPIRIAVIDNGKGISEDIQQSLFDPFVTTKRKGTGLGLALVAKLISDHGGIIETESEPGRTEFSIHLPMASEPPVDVGAT